MAESQGVTLREFLLENLNRYKNLTRMAEALRVTPQRVRIDMSRTGVLEVRRYYVPGDGRGVQSVVRWIPTDAVLPEFLPVTPPH